MNYGVVKPIAPSKTREPRAFFARVVAAVAALAMSLGFAVTAVALAPAAQAGAGDVSRIQVSKVFPTSTTTYDNWIWLAPHQGRTTTYGPMRASQQCP